jgi:hypothetical protein
MRAITVSDGKGKRVRFNADQIASVTPAVESDGPCVHVYLVFLEDEMLPFTVVLQGESGEAFLEWWDGEARRGGGYIGGNDPQAAKGDGGTWVPAIGDRVAMKVPPAFAAPETYMGVVRNDHDDVLGTVVVNWDDGHITSEAITALQWRP